MTDEPIQSGWTVVALCRGLRRGGVSPSTVAGQEIAVWRSATGKVRAWNNRCPHRGMRLSHGFVRGERLACLYHGWHYDGSGKCDYIPAHPDLEPPASIRAVVHPCIEAGAFVWVGGDPDNAPDLPTGFGAGVRSLTFDMPAERLKAALMARWSGQDSGAGLLRLTGDPLPCPVLAAVQPMGDGAVLHLAAPDATDADALCAIADAAETFRLYTEAGETAE